VRGLFFWKRDDVDDVSFPQLVVAHFLRRRELYAAAHAGAPSTERALQGPAEAPPEPAV
jgi:hypothetical protein